MTITLNAPAYTRLAAHYDRFVGHRQFSSVRRIFEHCVRSYGLRFSSAADFGCGSGLFAGHLARRWRIPVYAVDRSPNMLGVARRHCAASTVALLLRDHKALTLPRPVDLITMFSFTLNLESSQEAVREVLDSVWRNLTPGGYWIVDFLTPLQPMLLPLDRGESQTRLVSPRSAHFCLGIRISSSRSRVQYRERHCGRLLSPVDLGRELQSRGFVLVDALDRATLGPAQHDSHAVVFIARKPCRQSELSKQEFCPCT